MKTPSALSRRDFIKGAAACAVALPMGSLLAACSSEAPEADDTTASDNEQESSTVTEPLPEPSVSGSVLVAYYSATGHTEGIAEAIEAELDADLFVITPTEPYSSDDLAWTDEGSHVSLEHEDPDGRHVELAETIPEAFDSYDVVFVGFPTWWQNASWVVDDFVKGNDFTGKTVIPFTTSSSSPLGDGGTNLAAMAGTGTWLDGMRFSGSASRSDVAEWIGGLGL